MVQSMYLEIPRALTNSPGFVSSIHQTPLRMNFFSKASSPCQMQPFLKKFGANRNSQMREMNDEKGSAVDFGMVRQTRIMEVEWWMKWRQTMNAIKATWENGRILPAEPVDWPEGSELV